jgi:2-(1,2-epoxy-1,2-dihydrophenyl)acetyl-CoA isomerase
MMLGDKIKAEEAERIGMIYKFFSDEKVEAEAEKLAQTLAQLPTKALAFTKQALNLSLEQNLEQQLKIEDVLQQKAASTNDFGEGVAAFLAKRKPDFKGD